MNDTVGIQRPNNNYISNFSNEAHLTELNYYDQLHAEKYRDKNQSFQQFCFTFANRLGSDSIHSAKILEAVKNHRFLPAGRVQAAIGAAEREVSPFNCAVSQKIEDDMWSIMMSCTKAAMILRLGTGIGFNFSHLRPSGALIKKTQTEASGPVSFMKIYDTMAGTIASAGHRRGAMMGIMNVSHPDIEKFIDAKMKKDALKQFNLSVGITDVFMKAVEKNDDWSLEFDGKIYDTIKAGYLWEKIIKNAYYSAEPGVIFIDRLNQNNNLWYCEDIEATNPCAEQPLPPNGLCLLGSFNLVAYIIHDVDRVWFDYSQLVKDVYTFVEAYDNIFDEAIYAVPEHREEALNKRRIGLGATGIANAIELLLGKACYGDEDFCQVLNEICNVISYNAYNASCDLAMKRGSFPLYNRDFYNSSKFISSMPDLLRDKIYKYGIRNSHLISYAPCGTISQCAWNVSSGIEPIFYHQVNRKVYMRDGLKEVTLNDFNVRHYDFKGRTLEECTVDNHIDVAKIIQKFTDSAISKTINVTETCSYEEYEQIYKKAYYTGLKGITVFRPTELRGAVINKVEARPIEEAYNCPSGVCAL